MPETKSRQEWILLIHQLPPKPTNLRVRIWRKLQKLGAVPIKNSVYVLPFNERTHEDFQWLKQEIEMGGGEATVFRAGSLEGATDNEIIAAFRKARNEEYARLEADLAGLTAAFREQKRGGHLSAGRLIGYEGELNRLHAELEHIQSIDFFKAPGGKGAVVASERCQNALRNSRSRKSASATPAKGNSLDPSKYQKRRWVTRRNLHIDRLASAWLIRQFIDKRPRFNFVADDDHVEDGIPFDMFGAEFTHEGEDCTFETLVKKFRLNDNPALREIAEIVHDIDLKDDKFHRLEAPGLNTLVSGLAELLKDDRKLLRQSHTVFDALYSLFGKGISRNKGGKSGSPKARSGTASGPRPASDARR